MRVRRGMGHWNRVGEINISEPAMSVASLSARPCGAELCNIYDLKVLTATVNNSMVDNIDLSVDGRPRLPKSFPTAISLPAHFTPTTTSRHRQRYNLQWDEEQLSEQIRVC